MTLKDKIFMTTFTIKILSDFKGSGGSRLLFRLKTTSGVSLTSSVLRLSAAVVNILLVSYDRADTKK